MPHASAYPSIWPPARSGILAIHGLGGHGQRWRTLATQHLPDIAVAAPDLIGHGRSSYSAPWTIDANVTALADLVKVESERPVLVVGHFLRRGESPLNLAAAHPDLVSGLILLDPAVGLDGSWMREIAAASTASRTTPTATGTRREDQRFVGRRPYRRLRRRSGRTSGPRCPNNRYGWRVFGPAIMSYWVNSPAISCYPNGIPTTLVRASRLTSTATAADLVDGLTQRLGAAQASSTSNADTWSPRHDQTTPHRSSGRCRLAIARVAGRTELELVRAAGGVDPAGEGFDYGDIASAAMLSSPRIVGWIVRTDSADLPWHRVITASGRPAAP